MENLIEFITLNPVGFLATVEHEMPRVRPFGFQFFEDGKFFFITSNSKDVYSQLLKTPHAEFSCISEDKTAARIKGHVVFSDNLQKKEKALNNSPVAKEKFKSADHPGLELFYLHNGEAILFDSSGVPIKRFSF